MARRHLLIGSGPASISAAEAIRSQDANAEIVIVGAEQHGYYSRPGLAYYLAKEVPERSLFPAALEDLERHGATHLVDRAIAIDPVAHLVTLERGGTLPYDRLLVATGSRAIPLDVPGAALDGVVKLDDMDDARDLIRRSRRARSAVVVGGGITALEIVEGLRARRVHVHYLMRKDRYWSNVLSDSESRIVEQGLQARGVQIHTFTELARILGPQGRVTAVETSDGSQIPCDLVAVAVGVLPDKELAETAGLACGRGILVDSHLRSSDEHIFAAGDVAEVREARTGRPSLEVLWSSAVQKGRIAGLNMATEPVHTYEKGVPAQRHEAGRLQDHDHGHRRQRGGLRPGGDRPRGQRDLAMARARRRSWSRDAATTTSGSPSGTAPSRAPSSWETRPSPSPCRSSSRLAWT